MNRRYLYGLLFLTVLFYFGTAPIADLYDENDTQYSGGASEMLQDHNWLVPTNNHLPRLQKPPIVYWLTIPSLMVFGHNETAARIPTMAIICLLVTFCYLIGERLGGSRRGFMAGLAMATCFGAFIFCRMILPEPYLTCFITGSLYCALHGYQEQTHRQRWYLAAWAFAALASLSKGLHGLLFPMAIIGILALLNPKSRPALRPLLSWSGLAVFLAIWAPWYVAMELKYPGFLQYHFINEQIGHVAGTHYPKDDSPVPYTRFLLQHLIWFFPWTLFAPAAWFYGRQLKREKIQTADPLSIQLPVVWLGVVFGALIFSNRQDYYAMSAWPAFALWVSKLWMDRERNSVLPCQLAKAALVVLLLIGLGGLIATSLGQIYLSGPGISSVAPTASRDNVWNALSGFSLNSWRHLLPLAWIAFGSMTVGSIVSIRYSMKGRTWLAATLVGVMMMGPLGAAAGGLSIMAPYFSLADVARYVNHAGNPQAMVIFEGEPHVASSLFFYLDRPAYWLGVPSQIEFACRKLHLGEDKFLAESTLPALWKGEKRIFFIVEESRADYWAEQVGAANKKFTPLVVSGTRWLVSNR